MFIVTLIRPVFMKLFRFLLAFLAISGIVGWLWFRQPYSPTQELAPISLTSFEVTPPSLEAGLALADAARTWPGVTAATYTDASQLLSLAHTEALTVAVLQMRLQNLTPAPVKQKIFPAPAGPQCPVPQEFLAALPGYFLVGGLISLLLLTLIFFRPGRFKTSAMARN